MILCLDAGNTRLKFGLHDGSVWYRQQAVESATVLANPGRWVSEVGQQLREPHQQIPERVVACSVAGAAMAAALEGLAAHLGLPLEWLRSSDAALGVSNGYANPRQLGNDRWAALLAARQVTHDACLVVIAGTATTVDGLNAHGRFVGGLILPGLRLMRQSLAGGTAQLPLAAGHYQPWPTNTDDAVTTGSLLATAGAITSLRAQLGDSGERVSCLLSGGAAEALRAHIAEPLIIVPELVLEGVARFACATGARCGTMRPPCA
ncbi:MAG: type III pantothenate kinase [Rhodocyclaceae bacterium]|jgi:type III pantothenate kinase|nr:type III pantothenate kinase [Rhodocyclaceae bacterium]MBK6908941.1 type III pantothenate kinase [Rhodocyclaceae bacterium]